MNKEQAIHVVEHLRGKRLSSLETMILAEAWDDQSYEYIAEISQRKCQYVKKVGARLWREVSELTGAWINKRNFCPAMRRYYYNQLPQTHRCRLLAVSWEGAVGGEKQTDFPLAGPVVDDAPGRALSFPTPCSRQSPWGNCSHRRVSCRRLA